MALIVVLLGACANEHTGSPVVPDGDFDDDGATEGVDCDDRAADVYPGAAEVDWDGVDQNCDGVDQQAVSVRSVGRSVAGKHVGSGLGFLSLGAGDLDGDGRDDALVGAGYIPSDNEPAVDEIWLVTGRGGIPDLTYAVDGEVGELVSFDVLRDDDAVVTLFANQSRAYGFEGDWRGDVRISNATIEYAVDRMELTHGDLDSDGIADLVFSDYLAAAVHVHLGPLEVSGDAADGDVVVRSADVFSEFGSATSVGDVNGDGHADLVVAASGAPEQTYVGAVFVFAGPLDGGILEADASWAQYLGTEEGEYVGWNTPTALRTVDLTGDGAQDLLIPSRGPAGGFFVGRSWLIDAPTPGTHVLTAEVPHVLGETATLMLGTGASLGTDLNGNGAPELLLSATRSDMYPGAIYGFDLPLDPASFSLGASAFAIVGERSGDNAGETVVTGDFDGDGRIDALIGATGVDVPDYEGAGTVTLVLAGALAP
jgi:hypothetical protein